MRFNGQIESLSNEYTVNSIVTFHCTSNLILRGSKLSKCQLNGTWSPKIPKCESSFLFFLNNPLIEMIDLEPESCPIPSLPAHARFLRHQSLPDQMADGTHLEYVCGQSRQRRRIFCRQGKILPRLPRCFRGIFNSMIDLNFNSCFSFPSLSSSKWIDKILEEILSSSRNY